jgi:RNA polymerase sigma-70 factor (ECF subfamily)
MQLVNRGTLQSERHGLTACTTAGEAFEVSRLRAGDEAAFLAVYGRHQARVYRFALRMSGNTHIAEDVTQETFLALLRGEGGFDPRHGSLRAYLVGTARNLTLRALGAERRTTTLEDDTGLAAESPAAGTDPLEGLARAEELELVRQAVLSLPLAYREVVALCDLEELSYAEAAEVLGCALGTVRSRLHRARALLWVKLNAVRCGA